jgi:TolR protein
MANKHRANKSSYNNKTISEINVVPYIDVMLVLLIIFMVTAPLMYQKIDVKLPETTSSDEVSKSEYFLAIDILNVNTYNINYSGELNNNISNIPFEKIQKYIKKNKIEEVYIRSDRNIEYGHLIEIMDSFKKNGINNIGLITEKNNDK